MFSADLILVWPDTVDFPLFRKWLREEREKFEKVIIVFHTTQWAFNTVRDFIKTEMLSYDIEFIDTNPNKGKDWRDAAVNTALQYSTSEWIFFTEPDFFPSKELWSEMERAPKSDIYAVIQDTRLHPCCIFIRRTLLNKTSLDFSANPPYHDHFGQIQKELADLNTKVAIINPKLYYHMNGLTHNMFLIQGGYPPSYKELEFKEYLRECLVLDFPLHFDFKTKVENYLYANVN